MCTFDIHFDILTVTGEPCLWYVPYVGSHVGHKKRKLKAIFYVLSSDMLFFTFKPKGSNFGPWVRALVFGIFGLREASGLARWLAREDS